MDPMSPLSPAATSDAFLVSPPSADRVRHVAVNSAAFFEDPQNGWCVGIVLGHAPDGSVLLRDSQRSVDVTAVKESAVVPVPTTFSNLSPEAFTSLATLAHLPAMPAAAWEPAILISLLHRLHNGLWEVPVTVTPPLVLSLAGPPSGLQGPTCDLAEAVLDYSADRCVVLMPAGPGVSHPTPGRDAFAIPKHYMKIPARDDVALRQTRTPTLLALVTLVESLTCYSSPGRPCVSGMVYSMELVHELDGHLRDLKVRPIAVDHALAGFVIPYPPQDDKICAVRSPYLAFLQLAESALVTELGLPPQQTLTAIMAPCHFDAAAPTFADARASLDLLQLGGRMGVQVWSVLGAILHLLIARWVILSAQDGVQTLFGILSPDEHVQWAAKCLQVPTEYLVQLVRHQSTDEGQQLAFEVTEGALASLAGHLYDRMVRTLFASAGERGHDATVAGFSTHIISVLPFETYSGVRRGYRCKKLQDREYLIDAVRGFYARHAPERTAQTETLVDSCLGSDGVSGLLASLEGKYNRPHWFATRERLHDLYTTCRPELTNRVDDFLVQYAGREDELFGALEAKYGFEETVRPPLSEQLSAFFERFDAGRLDEVEPLARKWKARPNEIERQLDESYDTSFLAHRRDAWRIYMRHNPDHLKYLDVMLNSEQYRERGGEFVDSLRARYEAEAKTEPPPSYADLFRLMRNSLHEVFHLLYMHHHYPQSDSIPMRQALVDMLISTAAPSIVASAIDSITSVTRHVSGRFIADEVVARFGGGYSPLVHAEGRRLSVDHTEAPCVYDMSAVWGMNSDPITHSALNESGSQFVRQMYQRSEDGTTWVSRCIKETTEVMATLGTVESPTSWVLSLDTFNVRTPGSEAEVNIPLVLRQLKHFYIDLIAAGGGDAPISVGAVSPPGRSGAQQSAFAKNTQNASMLSEEERERRKAALLKPLPGVYREGGGVAEEKGGGDGGGSGDAAIASVALLSSTTQLQQSEWMQRRQLEHKQAYITALLHLHHSEGLGRTHTVLEEFHRRCTILQALKMRAAYTMLAESMLRIERRERLARERLMEQFYSGRGVHKLQDLERMGRRDAVREEREARAQLFQITVPVSNALQRKEIRQAYEKYFVPFQERNSRQQQQQQPDINRFLELMEEEEHYRCTRDKVLLAPEGATHTHQPQPLALRAQSAHSTTHERARSPSAASSRPTLYSHEQQLHQPQDPPPSHTGHSTANTPFTVNIRSVPEPREDQRGDTQGQEQEERNPFKARNKPRSGSYLSTAVSEGPGKEEEGAEQFGNYGGGDSAPATAAPLTYEEEKAAIIEKLRQFTSPGTVQSTPMHGGGAHPLHPLQQHQQVPGAEGSALQEPPHRSLSPTRGPRPYLPLVTPPLPYHQQQQKLFQQQQLQQHQQQQQQQQQQHQPQHQEQHQPQYADQPGGVVDRSSGARAPSPVEVVHIEDVRAVSRSSSFSNSNTHNTAHAVQGVQHREQPQRGANTKPSIQHEADEDSDGLTEALMHAVASSAAQSQAARRAIEESISVIERQEETQQDSYLGEVQRGALGVLADDTADGARRPVEVQQHQSHHQPHHHPQQQQQQHYHQPPSVYKGDSYDTDEHNSTPLYQSAYREPRSLHRFPPSEPRYGTPKELLSSQFDDTPTPRHRGDTRCSQSRSRSRSPLMRAGSTGRSASRPSSGRFLQKGQGTLASDRTGSGRGLSPARPQGGYAVPGRVSPSGRSGAGRFPSPRVRAPQGESRDVDAIQASFDHVRSLVVKLVDLQQQLQREQNASPSRQRRLSERMFRVREELLRLQPPG